jgi:hypothetical protein
MSDQAKFYACLGILCLVFPPLLGLVLGIGFVFLLWYFFYKLLGGTG